MDALEKIFRQKPQNKIVLRYYVEMLLEQGHLLESRYFVDKLLEIDPDDLESNRLGYRVAIETMNPNVRCFEEKLMFAGISQEELYALQLHYYFTFNDQKKAHECALGLLNIEPTKK